MKKITFLIFIILIFSTSLFPQWQKLNFPSGYVSILTKTPNGLLAANETTIYNSLNMGAVWDSVYNLNGGISNILNLGSSLLLTECRLLAMSSIPYPKIPSIYKSDDDGLTWHAVLNASFGGSNIISYNSDVYAVLDDSLFCSPDSGKSWSLLNSVQLLQGHINSIEACGNFLYILNTKNVLYRSGNNGQTWDSIYTSPVTIYDNLYSNKSVLYFINAAGDINSSLDNGITWGNLNYNLPSTLNIILPFFYKDYLIIAGSYSINTGGKTVNQFGLFYKNIDDTTWYNFNEGLSGIDNNTIALYFANDNQFLYMATSDGLWGRPVSEIATGIANKPDKTLPYSFKISNYPNPFNPSTIIEYQIPAACLVNISVYNVLGKEVSCLENCFKNSGKYEINFNASGLPSDIYFCRIKAGKYIKTIKMVLMK